MKHSYIAIVFIISVLFSGCLPGISHYNNGLKYLHNNQYEMSINEYMTALNEIQSDPQYYKRSRKLIEFASYNNIGACYLYMGNYNKAYDYFKKAIISWPERAYYPLVGMANIDYIRNNYIDANKNIEKAHILVSAPDVNDIEKDSTYGADTIKYRIYGIRSYMALLNNFNKLKHAMKFKNIGGAKIIAQSILSEKYYIDIGIDCGSNKIDFIRPGSIADINGILNGDQIVSINDKTTKDADSINDELSRLYDKYDNTINIKLVRNSNEITISCRLTYIELEQTKKILSDLENRLLIHKKGNRKI